MEVSFKEETNAYVLYNWHSQEQNARDKRWGLLLPHEHPGVLREFVPTKTNFLNYKGEKQCKKSEKYRETYFLQ
jgi:hypothetical protein